MVLASHRLPISDHFSGLDSGCTYLVDSEFAASVVIEALNQGDVKSFTFRFHEIGIEKFDDTSNVLSTFIGGEVNYEFEKLFIRVFLEGNLLVEYELVVGGW